MSSILLDTLRFPGFMCTLHAAGTVDSQDGSELVMYVANYIYMCTLQSY